MTRTENFNFSNKYFQLLPNKITWFTWQKLDLFFFMYNFLQQKNSIEARTCAKESKGIPLDCFPIIMMISVKTMNAYGKK